MRSFFSRRCDKKFRSPSADNSPKFIKSERQLVTESNRPPLNVVCLASYFKGVEFLRECKRQGNRVVLITKEKNLHEDWPRESLDEIVAVPDAAGPELLTHIVGQLARQRKIDRLVALEEYDVLTAAMIREHLRMPGMGVTAAHLFRDKLAMRVRARQSRIRVPEFVHALNYDDLGEYMGRVPAPWVLKPRSDVSAVGIKKLHDSEQVWRAIDALDGRELIAEQSPNYLLEHFVDGDVYHVDSLVDRGKVVFAGVSCYGRPPMDVAHQGGVFISHSVERDTDDHQPLLYMNRRLMTCLGLKRGTAHAEFIKSRANGKFYFLEVGARVGGAYIAETLEAASGLNLWREWAKIELINGEAPYEARPTRNEYSGIVLSLARQEYPDTSAYTEPEIVDRIKRRYHVGLIVRSPKLDRVKELLNQYAARFNEDFCAVAPPLERTQ